MSDPKSSKIPEFNDDSLRQIAREIVIRRFVLRTHALIYLFTNLLLFVINYTTNYTYTWHWWSVVAWGVALAIHAFSYVTYRKGLISTTSGGFMAYHLFIYVIVCSLLLFIDWFTNPLHVLSWFYWPFGAWSVAIVVHLIQYFGYRPKSDQDKHKSWVDRQVDEELKKVQKN